MQGSGYWLGLVLCAAIGGLPAPGWAGTFSTTSPPQLDLILAPGAVSTEQVSLTIHPFCVRPIEVGLATSPPAQVANLTGVLVNNCGGETSVFQIQFTGTATPQTFDLQFVDAEFGGVLDTIPVTTTPAAQAPDPAAISVQGVVLDPDGNPVHGRRDIGLRVWSHPDSLERSALVYEESHRQVEVVDGVFSLELGQGMDASRPFDERIFSGLDRWLEYEVAGEVLEPRQKFTSVAYALQCRGTPRARGRVTATGTLLSGSANVVSVTYNPALARYEIGFSDFAFSGAHAAVVTPSGATPRLVSVASEAGSLHVHVEASGGGPVQNGFSFVVWE